MRAFLWSPKEIFRGIGGGELVLCITEPGIRSLSMLLSACNRQGLTKSPQSNLVVAAEFFRWLAKY